MKKAIFAVSCAIVFSAVALGQPRAPEKASAPASTAIQWEARYEGGVFGSSAKEHGTIKIDEANERVVFYRKADNREMFSIPYEALVVLYPDSKDSVPQKGKVISALPLPGAGLANLMSKSTKFANLTFEDPDIDVKGTASFRFDDKEQLLSFISSLGTRAKMTQRGDAYYRPKKKSIF
jgi:hypothetical protein